MKTPVHLLYFDGCPNVGNAREAIRRVLEESDLPAHWEEIDLRSPTCPPRWKGFPSPTVMAHRIDVVSGAAVSTGTSSCRFGGAPSAAQIAARLGRRSPWTALAALPAAAVGFLPAAFCPACYPALAGLLGALGLGAAAERVLAPLTLALLLVALVGLAYQARRSRGYRPLIVGALGAAEIYAGQFFFALAPMKYVGIGLLIGASFWNNLPRRRKSDGSCSSCAEGHNPTA